MIEDAVHSWSARRLEPELPRALRWPRRPSPKAANNTTQQRMLGQWTMWPVVSVQADTNVYKQFVENESFKRFVSDLVYRQTSAP
jgi:hypothetical protein